MAFYGNWIPARLRGRRTSFKLLPGRHDEAKLAALPPPGPATSPRPVSPARSSLRALPAGASPRPAPPSSPAPRSGLPHPAAPGLRPLPAPRLRLLDAVPPLSLARDRSHAPGEAVQAPVSFTGVLDAHSARLHAPARADSALPVSSGLQGVLHSLQGLLETRPAPDAVPPIPMRLRVLPSPSPDRTPLAPAPGGRASVRPVGLPRLHRPQHGLPMGPDPRHCSACGGALERRLLKPTEPQRLVCTACEEVTWPDPKIATGILALYNDELVLIRRSNQPGYGKWVFPGGYVDRGERVEDAARREAREEAHLEVRDLELVGVYSYPDSPVILVTYCGQVTGGEPRAGDEALDVKTWALDAIPWHELAFRSTYDALQDFVKRRST